MEVLKELHDSDIGLVNQAIESYDQRTAVRAIIRNGDKIALQWIGKYGFYKLPGGGVDEGEEHIEALRREIREEVGCEINIVKEVGQIIEYRDEINLRQVSLCYLVDVVGDVGVPEFTPEEIEEETESLWVEPQEALRLIKESKPDIYVGKFCVIRDAILLEAAL